MYEGLTNYYGYVLAARSGVADQSTIKTKLAIAAADMQCQSGRGWRSTEDTATGVAPKAKGPSRWESYLRGTDYYDEGTLLWLDVDTLIRERSHETKTLDDFARRFFDTTGETQPLVVPYTLNEVVSALEETLPFDWASFIQERVQTPRTQANLAGFKRAGYKFYYTDKQIESPVPNAQRRHAIRVAEDGTIFDVQRFSRADEAGVRGHKYSLDELTEAIAAAQGPNSKAQLTLQGDEESWDTAINHNTGLVYPTLELHDGLDLLASILAPRTKGSKEVI